MEYTVRYKGHDIMVMSGESAPGFSSCTYRIDDWLPERLETALEVEWPELRDDALLMAKAVIDRLPEN